MLSETASGELPSGWTWRRIREFAREGDSRAGANSGLPVLSVTKHRGLVLASTYFKKAVHGRDTANYKVVAPGEFAYATIHLNEGSIGLAGDGQRGLVSPMYTVFGVDGAIDRSYLFTALKARSSLALFDRMCQGTVNRRASVPFSSFASLFVATPPLAEQRKIAAILSSVDETIEKTEAVIAHLDVVKKAMLEELLTRGIPGRHSRFKQTEIGEVPGTWEVAPIRAVAKVVRGSSPRPAGDPRYFNGSFVPWITVGEITRDPWPFLERTVSGLTKEGHERSRLLRRGTVVLTNSGATLGVPKILRIDGCANDGVAALLDLSTGIDPLFAYYVLLKMTEEFRRDVARGVGQPNLNTDLIGDVLLPIPDLLEQGAIAAALFSIDERVRVEAEAQAVLRKVKESLAAQLLSGASRVGI